MNDLPDRAADTDTGQPASAAAPIDSAAAVATDPLAGVMSGREAAAALGVSERTIRRAIQRGDLAATKHAGSFHITPAALEAYKQRPDAGQHTLLRAATSDTGHDNSAAAPDRTTDNLRAAAAAEDIGQGYTRTERMLLTLLEQERRESNTLREASAIWQARAMQLEERLKALESGPIAQNAGDVTLEEAPATSAAALPTIVGSAASRSTEPAPAFSLRQWWRRLTGSE